MKLKLLCPSVLFAATSSFLLTGVSMRASETDDRIESAAASSFVYKTYLKDDSIQTKSKSGVVTLKGTVKEGFHKSLAADTVGGLPGVKSVDNQLVLKGETSTDNADRWLRLKVETALLFHRNVHASTTTVTALNGTVTLSGEASDKMEKDLTTAYAEDVSGVKSVNNEMTISTTPPEPHRTLGDKIDDASITALVKAVLLVHLSTSAINTKVETRDGVVTVSGVAESAAEKKQVTNLAGDIHGVDKVVNEMSISKK